MISPFLGFSLSCVFEAIKLIAYMCEKYRKDIHWPVTICMIGINKVRDENNLCCNKY